MRTKSVALILCFCIIFSAIAFAPAVSSAYLINPVEMTAYYNEDDEAIELNVTYSSALPPNLQAAASLYKKVTDPSNIIGSGLHVSTKNSQNIIGISGNSLRWSIEFPLSTYNECKGDDFYLILNYTVGQAVVAPLSLPITDIPLTLTLDLDFAASASRVAVGDEVTVDITAKNIASSAGEGLTSLQFDLIYDASAFEYKSLEIINGAAAGNDWTATPSVVSGKITAFVGASDAFAVSGDGLIGVSVKFKAIALGSSGFAVSDIRGEDDAGAQYSSVGFAPAAQCSVEAINYHSYYSIGMSLADAEAFLPVETVENGEIFALVLSINDIGLRGLMSVSVNIDFDADFLEAAEIEGASAAFIRSPAGSGWECGGYASGSRFYLNAFDSNGSTHIYEDGEVVIAVFFKAKQFVASEAVIEINTVADRRNATGSFFYKGALNESLFGTSRANGADGTVSLGITSAIKLLAESGALIKNGYLFCPEKKTEAYIKSILNHAPENLSVKNVGGGLVSADDYAGTGFTVELSNQNGDIISSITIIVLGDVNSDGIINTTDFTRILYYFIDSGVLSPSQRIAADTNMDNSLSSNDYTRLKSYFLDVLDLYQIL